MAILEHPGSGLRGHYRDTLRGPDGRTIWQREWRSNVIVADCRRLLATFLHGAPPTSLGIQGLLLGAGSADWDRGGAPTPTGNETAPTDANPFLVTVGDLQLDYLEGGTVSATPTNRLQIFAALGPNVPDWPDPNHVSASLREFGLVAELNGSPVLINYVVHPVIAKDPASTLERTIWLVF